MAENKKIPYKIYLEESEMPTQWYNVRADMKNKPAPLLNPATLEPMKPEELEHVFCKELVQQELDDTTPYFDIPQEIRDFYKMYRPSPLVRAYCLEKALDTMARAVKACDEAGFEDCILCPETMGKVNQLGTLDEVLALCEVDPRITPCIDFGHLYARSCGVQFADATAAADYAALLDTLAARLGDDRAVHFHAHFSRIAYTKGGEKCHLTFADTAFGPPHAPLLALLKERHLAPTIICESAGTQAEDAAALAQGYAAL